MDLAPGDDFTGSSADLHDDAGLTRPKSLMGDGPVFCQV